MAQLKSSPARLQMPTLVKLALLAAALACRFAVPVHTQSPASNAWPGLWGPARDGVAAVNAGARAPRAVKELWRRPAAGGYSEMVTADDRIVTLELRDGMDYVVALDAQSGRDRWHTRIGTTVRGHDGSHDGPISTPAVDGGDVFALGANGHLVALDAATGKERWRQDLGQAHAATPPSYGFGTSPLIDRTHVIVQTGGEKSLGLLAFERVTGRLAWSAPHTKSVGYSSPVAGMLAGTRQIVAASGDRVFGVSPADGRLLWSVAGPGQGEEITNSPALLPDDRVLLTFWDHAVLLKVSRQNDAWTAAELWRSARLRGAHGPTIYKDGFLYGFGGVQLLCLDAATGEVRWRQRTYEGSLVALGSHLLLLGRGSGDLQVIRASPDAFTEVLRTRVFTPGATSITGPSFAGGRIYVRNVEEMAAFLVEG